MAPRWRPMPEILSSPPAECADTPEQAIERLAEQARAFWARNTPEGAIAALGLDRPGPMLPGDTASHFYKRLPRDRVLHIAVFSLKKKV